jgi:hypothetical protein
MAFKIVQRYGRTWGYPGTRMVQACHYDTLEQTLREASEDSLAYPDAVFGVCGSDELYPAFVLLNGIQYESPTHIDSEAYQFKNKYIELVTGTFTDAYGVYIGYFEPEQWGWEDSMRLWKQELIELGENVEDIIHWWEEEHDLLGDDEEEDDE